jgi:adenylate kinase
MKIVLLGQIASGKGTLSQALQEKYGFIPVSIGLLLRKECEKDTEESRLIQSCLEKGNLVSDDLALKVLKNYLNEIGDKNIIFDGYPRNKAQAESLDKIADIDHVLFLNITDEIVKERFLGRRECEKCGYVSNVNYSDYNGTCPRCSGKLAKRNDLNEEAMKNKMASFEKDTKPLISYYDEKGLLREIDASKGKDLALKDAEQILQM